MPTTSPLTARQCEVLELLAAGRSTVELAAELAISPNTVKRHVEQMLRKLKASNRAHAVAQGFRAQLLT